LNYIKQFTHKEVLAPSDPSLEEGHAARKHTIPVYSGWVEGRRHPDDTESQSKPGVRVLVFGGFSGSVEDSLLSIDPGQSLQSTRGSLILCLARALEKGARLTTMPPREEEGGVTLFPLMCLFESSYCQPDWSKKVPGWIQSPGPSGQDAFVVPFWKCRTTASNENFVAFRDLPVCPLVNNPCRTAFTYPQINSGQAV